MMQLDLLIGLLLLVFVNGVLGVHRIKMEKGYNLQERPASENEGEPLEIRLVTYSDREGTFLFVLTYFCNQTICVLHLIDCNRLHTNLIYVTIKCLDTVHLILRKNSPKGEHQSEEHSGRDYLIDCNSLANLSFDCM